MMGDAARRRAHRRQTPRAPTARCLEPSAREKEETWSAFASWRCEEPPNGPKLSDHATAARLLPGVRVGVARRSRDAVEWFAAARG